MTWFTSRSTWVFLLWRLVSFNAFLFSNSKWQKVFGTKFVYIGSAFGLFSNMNYFGCKTRKKCWKQLKRYVYIWKFLPTVAWNISGVNRKTILVVANNFFMFRIQVYWSLKLDFWKKNTNHIILHETWKLTSSFCFSVLVRLQTRLGSSRVWRSSTIACAVRPHLETRHCVV